MASGKRAAHVLAINLWIGLPRLTTTATLQVRPNSFAEDNFAIPNNHSLVQSLKMLCLPFILWILLRTTVTFPELLKTLTFGLDENQIMCNSSSYRPF